jgi:endonuclease-3 related protein
MDIIKRMYRSLYNKYGPQGWWPADTACEIIAGAVLAQGTAWQNAGKAIANLKAEGALEPNIILGMDGSRLRGLIRPSGFFNQKALRLKSAMAWFASNAREAGLMDRMELRGQLLAINGIGRETADSIALYAFNKPIFVIDAYTRRFCAEYGIMEKGEYDGYRLRFEMSLGLDAKVFSEYHALLVAWGKSRRAARKTS